MTIRWRLAFPSGEVRDGAGRVDHLGAIASEAVAGMFVGLRPGQTLIVAGAPDLLWTVQRSTDPARDATFWGVGCAPGSRVWLGRGDIVGVGPSVEAVERAWAALQLQARPIPREVEQGAR